MIFLFLFQTELSHNLQQLSERAKSTTEFIQRLKGMSDKVNVSILQEINFKFAENPRDCHNSLT